MNGIDTLTNKSTAVSTGGVLGTVGFRGLDLLLLRVLGLGCLELKMNETRYFNTYPICHKTSFKVRKTAKIRKRYNQVPHLTRIPHGKVTKIQ